MSFSELEDKICRYYNTIGGCWNGEKCRFLHITDTKPACKFFMSPTGCRFGDSCHFSHDPEHFKDIQNYEDGSGEGINKFKENMGLVELSGTNNNNMEQSNSNNSGSVAFQSHLGATGQLETNAFQIQCGSCHMILKSQGEDSFCNQLKSHYLENFLDKEGEHIKAVKSKTGLSEPGQMLWCKTCLLCFEKPWSLFQHMADKARGIKVQRWDKKVHADWLETVAGLMAGFDLGLFTNSKLRRDLRHLISDNGDEEMELMTSPWRLQHREMMRRLDQVNRQIHRRGGLSALMGSLALGTPTLPLPKTPQVSDTNCGFTDAEVEELRQQGIKPWDEEAAQALAILHGEYDYLLTP